MDSVLAKIILEEKYPELKSYYYNFDSPYGKHESDTVTKYNRFARKHKLNAVTKKKLTVLNKSGYTDVHIPMRNLLLILHSVTEELMKVHLKVSDNASYVSDDMTDTEINVYFPQILELGPDKNSLFFKSLTTLLRKCYNYNIKLHTPFKNLRKSELIQKAMEVRSDFWFDKYQQDMIDMHNNHIWLETFSYSCYKGETPVCGECYGCTERQIAYFELGWVSDDAYPKRWRRPLRNLILKDIFHWRDIFQVFRIWKYETFRR